MYREAYSAPFVSARIQFAGVSSHCESKTTAATRMNKFQSAAEKITTMAAANFAR